MTKTRAVNFRGVPEDLWNHYKSIAVRKGKTAKDFFIEHMKRVIKEQESQKARNPET